MNLYEIFANKLLHDKSNDMGFALNEDLDQPILISLHCLYEQLATYEESLVVRKPIFCMCEYKDADQLRGNREADQRLRFRYTDTTIPLLSKQKYQAFSHLLWLYRPVCVGPGSETPKTGFLITRLKFLQ